MTPAAGSLLLAAPKIPEGEGPEWGKAAPIGLLVILLLCIAAWLLFRSMAKHLRKVREAAAAQAAEDSAVPGTGDDADRTGADALDSEGPEATDGVAPAGDAGEHLTLHKD